MKNGVTIKRCMLLVQMIVTMTFAFAGLAVAADSVQLQASPPATMFYTTNGAEPVATTTYTNYYVAEGTKISPPTAISFTDTPLGASERISLVPNAGKGRPYVKPEKLKIHGSKKEFVKHVKEKHGKRYGVEEFRVLQTEHGLDSYMYIVENRNPSILQINNICTEAERAYRIAVAKDFILNNSDLIGLTENEELRELGRERTNCRSLYFNAYINEYKLEGAQIIITFVPQHNYSMSFQLKPIIPEMYEAAQQPALSAEDIARIVYADLNIPLGNTKPPKLTMYKYLRSREPYAIWEVSGRYRYEINAITGKIERKVRNIVPN